ncbi:MAG: hypothetical protein HY301_10320 [Verrucomicrobia bacterium]|nr:hypothetical protein [Verrucomicrobiota bacterium]
MRKIVFTNNQSPGDILMLSAAVRDLHLRYPGQFLTDVGCECPELWENNPHVTPLSERDPEVEAVEAHYPLIHQSNRLPYHFIHGFIHDLNDALGLEIQPTAFKGDIHLSEAEKAGPSLVEEVTGVNAPFWILVAGGKFDFTIKWWEARRFQEVVDQFKGRIQFVQVGEAGHFHQDLNGVIDLRGKTTLREMVKLMYHAQGVVCPVTLAMHLAAAVPVKDQPHALRPCVVVAGGREPVHWEAYPGHQFLHTVGALSCCRDGGCWQSRTFPLGDGDEKDSPYSQCLNRTERLPKCMDLITSGDVGRAVERYFEGGSIKYLEPESARAYREFLDRESPQGRAFAPSPILTKANAKQMAEHFLKDIPPYPTGYEGRGVVIVGGGSLFFTCAWVCIKMLRRAGCQLPVELWHLGPDELDDRMKELVAPPGVRCVDAFEVRKKHPARVLKGWELKPYAILHSRFKEVLYLDADNVPVRDPEYLFASREFQETGALFWPDVGDHKPNP